MTQPDELAVPAKIPDELWREINHLRSALLAFSHHARMSVEAKELRTGEHEFDLYRWLEPLVVAASQMRRIKRYATAEIIPFSKKVERVG